MSAPQPSQSLWVWRVPAVGDLSLAECLPILSTAEQALYHTIKSPRRQREYLAGHYLLRRVLDYVLPDWQENHHFDLDKDNWLNLIGPQAAWVDFNLSHSGEWVACAVGLHCQLGVDIESPRRRRSYRALAAEYFAESESRQLAELPEEQCRQRFYELWTLKESYLKTRKLGISAKELGTGFVPVAELEVDWYCYSFQLPEALGERVFGAFTVSVPLALPLEIQQFSIDKPVEPLLALAMPPLTPDL